MDEQFLEAVLAYTRALNEAATGIVEQPYRTPYVQFVPVLMDANLCGFLSDEIGGEYQYLPATDAQREWWEARPK